MVTIDGKQIKLQIWDTVCITVSYLDSECFYCACLYNELINFNFTPLTGSQMLLCVLLYMSA